MDNEITSSSCLTSNSRSNNIITLLRQRQYGLTNRKSLISSVFHTNSSSLTVYKRKSSLSKQRNTTSRKRTVSENDENRRDNSNEQTSKRLCRSSEWIFGDSQLTLFKSISTIDNHRTSIIHEQQTNYLLSKSDEYLGNNNHRRYSTDKQQTIDTLSTLVLSQ